MATTNAIGNKIKSIEYPGTMSVGSLLMGLNTTEVSIIQPSTEVGYALLSNGTGTAPSYQSIAATGAFTWAEKTGTSGNLLSNHGYIFTSLTLCTFSLPATPTIGDRVGGLKDKAGGFYLTCAGSQVIKYGSGTGTSGIITTTTTAGYRKVEVTYTSTNTWYVTDISGDFNLQS